MSKEYTPTEQRYANAVRKFEAVVKRNASCRKRRKVRSCLECNLWDSCKGNNYSDILDAMTKAGSKISNSWQINKEVRGEIKVKQLNK
jgi:hypothetical protein